jgi:ADP-ribose pyrophosphatase YjhB (NUDIX family)
MRFCSTCGGPVSQRVPSGETLLRDVCDTCHTVHYQNPKIVVGCIAEWDGRSLLCRRAIEPRQGLWTFPAGFMEEGETLEQAATRETWEEAEADVELTALHGVFSLPHVSQVYVVYRGSMKKPDFRAGAESLEVQLCAQDALPWEETAFPVIREALERYVSDQQQGRFQVHVGVVARSILI